ncbi:MAG: M67 family metallopeptidase [Actinomycetota bacterium]|nr:M67 family metallopeptidase [Actinomycetota bacterium]
MLRLGTDIWLAIVDHALHGLPDEACGLIAGPPPGDTPRDQREGRVERWYPCRNAAASSRVYTVDPRDHLKADRDAEDRGLEIIGVVHSHTHTWPWPSPTDVRQAPDPGWHYAIVSLRHPEPMMRSFSIVDGNIAEEAVVLDQ